MARTGTSTKTPTPSPPAGRSRPPRNAAFAAARKAFPELPPSRAAGFAVSEDGKTLFISGYDVPVCLVLHHPTDIARLRTMLPDAEPSYSHRVGDTVQCAPPEPLLHKCPDCEANEEEGRLNRKKAGIGGIRKQTHRLTYLRSFTEQWGCVVTRHDVYRCRNCGEKWVSTNGREPEVAAPGI